MEEKESTDTGSLGGNSENDSPPVSSFGVGGVAGVGGGAAGGGFGGFGGFGVGAIGAGGGVVVPQIMNMGTERSAAAQPPSGGVVSGGVVVGGGGGGGGGSGGLVMGQKKRGRPRKYDADGNLRVQYMASPPGSGGGGGGPTPPPGFSFSSPSSGEFSSSKRGRGRPPGSGNWQLLASLGELFANTAGADFTPHVVTAHTGEDVAGKIYSLAQKGPRGICILAANGTISNVTIRQPGSSGGLLTYEGRFEILSLTGSFTLSENGGIKTRAGGLSVSLAGPDGRVVGGGVAGALLAATPIQIIVGSFMPNGYKTHKKRQHTEPRMTPVATAPGSATAAIPISQAAPQSNISQNPASQMPAQSQREPDDSTSNKDNPNSTSSDSAGYNHSGPSLDQRPYPDINVSISMDYP